MKVLERKKNFWKETKKIEKKKKKKKVQMKTENFGRKSKQKVQKETKIKF